MPNLKKLGMLVVLVCALSGCSSSNDVTQDAYVHSKEAYTQIQTTYEVAEDFSSDLYSAWKAGIYDKEEMSVEYLASITSLTEEEIYEGICYAILEIDNAGGYYSATNQERADAEYIVEYYFAIYEESMFSACISVVSGAYELSGKISIAQESIESAASDIKAVSDIYSEYEHYSSLKGYYASVNAFLDFCINPTGSFIQFSDTINNYQTQARDYKSELSYIFEE